MLELTVFHDVQIIGAVMVGASVSKVADFFVHHEALCLCLGMHTGRIEKLYLKNFSGDRNACLTDTERRALLNVVVKNKKFILAKVIVEMNTETELTNPISTKTV